MLAIQYAHKYYGHFTRSSLTGIAVGAALVLTIIAAVVAGYFIVKRSRSHRVPGVIDLQDKQVYAIENIMLPGIANS